MDLIGKEFKVLDKGFIRVVDIMGDDRAVVEAARVSYGSGTKTLREDAGLNEYLMQNEHMTPFEMVEVKIIVKMPIFVARQWVRHRTANINEYSARYSIVPDDYYVPEVGAILGQSNLNRQKGGEPICLKDAEKFVKTVHLVSKGAYRKYKQALDMGVSRELARMLLPVNYYTVWYWKCDLRNLLNFIRLRNDGHAQSEIQAYAKVLREVVAEAFPQTFQSFVNTVENRVILARNEAEAARDYMRGQDDLMYLTDKHSLRKSQIQNVKTFLGL